MVRDKQNILKIFGRFYAYLIYENHLFMQVTIDPPMHPSLDMVTWVTLLHGDLCNYE